MSYHHHPWQKCQKTLFSCQIRSCDRHRTEGASEESGTGHGKGKTELPQLPARHLRQLMCVAVLGRDTTKEDSAPWIRRRSSSAELLKEPCDRFRTGVVMSS